MPVSKNKEKPSKSKTKSSKPPKKSEIQKITTASKNPQKTEDNPPEVPEGVKELIKHGWLGSSVSWCNKENRENPGTDNKKSSKPKCFRYEKDYMIVKYSDMITIQKIEAPRTRTMRLAMWKAGITPKGGFKEFDEITEEVYSDSDMELDEKMRKEAKFRKRNQKRGKKYEELMKIKMALNQKRKEKENLMNSQKTSESENQKKKFGKSYYVLEELNEKSSYFVEKSEGVKIPEDVKMSHEVLGIPEKLIEKSPEAQKLEISKIPENVKKSLTPPESRVEKTSEDVKTPEAQIVMVHKSPRVPEDVKISRGNSMTAEKVTEKASEDVKALEAQNPKTSKIPEDVKILEDLQKIKNPGFKVPEDVKAPEGLQNKKNPEFIQSNYIAKELNEASGYCSQKDSGFSKDGDVQKTLKDSEGSKSQNSRNS